MNITFEVRGDREVVGRLDSLPDRLRVVLRAKVYSLVLRLEDHIKTQKLSGQVLNVVTGRLRRSIFSKVTETQDAIIGEVSSSGDVKYAARHEFGFSGQETVRAHTREIKQAFGQIIEPKTVAVRAFTRQANTPERSFMRSSFNDLRAVLRGELEAAAHGVEL